MIEELEKFACGFDRAQQREEQIVSDAIAHARRAQQRMDERMPATGYCHSCGDPVIDYQGRFCDLECRDDWQRVQAAEHRNGRPE